MSVAVAVAQPGQGSGKGAMKMKHRPNPEQMAKELGLTAEQTAAMRAAHEAFQVQMIDLKANIQKARLEVRKLVNQDTVNREAVMKAVEAESAASLALRKAVVEQQIKAREIIGPEKAAQLREMRQERGYGDGGRRDDDSNDRDGDSGDRGRGEGPGGDW
jgi:Spy/CpxP family protein refolding chaperone